MLWSSILLYDSLFIISELSTKLYLTMTFTMQSIGNWKLFTCIRGSLWMIQSPFLTQMFCKSRGCRIQGPHKILNAGSLYKIIIQAKCLQIHIFVSEIVYWCGWLMLTCWYYCIILTEINEMFYWCWWWQSTASTNVMNMVKIFMNSRV